LMTAVGPPDCPTMIFIYTDPLLKFVVSIIAYFGEVSGACNRILAKSPRSNEKVNSTGNLKNALYDVFEELIQ